MNNQVKDLQNNQDVQKTSSKSSSVNQKDPSTTNPTSKTSLIKKTTASIPQSKIEQTKVEVKPTTPKITQPKNLPAQIFQVKINDQAMFDVILADRASIRQGTHKVKDRSEVRGGGRKPWRQKGTGRARAGSIRSPIWRGGGIVFGPNVNRNYSLKINKKIRKAALNSALTLKAQNHAILIHEFKLSKPSTKELLTQIKDLNLSKDVKKFLVITDDVNVFKSANNVKTIFVNKLNSLHVESILHADVLIFAPSDYERLVK